MVHAEPDMAVAVASWIDAAQRHEQLADELFRRAGASDVPDNALRDRLRQSVETARHITEQIHLAARGEQAAAILVDQEDLKVIAAQRASPDARTADRVAQALQQANDDLAAELASAGISASAADVAGQLRSAVDAERSMLHERAPVDFPAVAWEWSREMKNRAVGPSGLERRLAAASQAEAVRQDADLARARDLDLAARAAGALTTLVLQATPKNIPIGPLNEFPHAIEALQREHLLNRQPPASHPPDESRAIHNAALRAREQLARWAGEASSQKTVASASRPGDLESLALRVNAETSRREYKRTADDDRAVAQKLAEIAQARRSCAGRRLSRGHAMG